MNSNPRNWMLALSQTVFERSLFLYPRGHRIAYGEAMAQLFRDQSREAWKESREWGLMKLWLRVLPDLARTSFIEHLSNLEPRKTMSGKIASVSRFPSPTSTFLIVAVVVFLLTLCASIVITFASPEGYASTACIKVERDLPNIPGMNNTQAPDSADYDPYFIQTTFEIMQSEILLSNVVTTLDLNDKWGKKFNNGETFKTSDSMAILKKIMSLTAVRNTKLIAITVYSDDPKEAAQIANSVAESYRQYRLVNQQQLALTGLKALQDQYDQETEQIALLQSNVEMLRKSLGIVDYANTMMYSHSIAEEHIRQLDAERLEFERLYTESASQLNDLKAYNTKQLRDVLPSVFPDPTLQSLLDKLHETEQDFAVKTNDYSLTNAVVLRVESELDTLNQQIDDRVIGLMAGISSKVDSQRASLDEMTKEVNNAKTKDLSDSPKNQPYYDARRDLEQLNEQHRLLYLKMDADRVDSYIPRDSTVQIVDPAKPGLVPIRPNEPLNILNGTLIGGFLGLIFGRAALLILHEFRKGNRNNPTHV